MNVKLTRIKQRLTQKQLADMIKVSSVTIVKIEKGDIDNVKFGTLKKLAIALNSSVQELFFDN